MLLDGNLHEEVLVKNMNYLDTARNDSTWREVVASMQISGFNMDASIEILAGQMISGELTLANVINIVTSSATAGSHCPIDVVPNATLPE